MYLARHLEVMLTTNKVAKTNIFFPHSKCILNYFAKNYIMRMLLLNLNM